MKKKTKKTKPTAQHPKTFYVVIGNLRAENNKGDEIVVDGQQMSATYYSTLAAAEKEATIAATDNAGDGACIFKVVKEIRMPQILETKTFK